MMNERMLGTRRRLVNGEDPAKVKRIGALLREWKKGG